MRWVAYIRLVGLYAASEKAMTPGTSDDPLILIESGRVRDLSVEAARCGVLPGTKVGQARHDCPGAVKVPFEKQRHQGFIKGLLDIYTGHSPLVEPLEEEVFLDLSGQVCPRSEVQEIIGQIVPRYGFRAFSGLAGSRLMAKTAGLVQFNGVGLKDSSQPAPTVINPGTEGAFLSALSTAYLWPLETAVRERLSSLGLPTIGEVASIAEKELCRRFGVLGRKIFEYSRGIDLQPVAALYPHRRIEYQRDFEGGVASRLALEAALGLVARTLAGRLEKDGAGCLRVTLRLQLAESARESSRGFSKPQADPGAIATALEILLTRLLDSEAGRPVTEFRVTLDELRPLVFEQTTLFDQNQVEAEQDGRLQKVLDALEKRFPRQMVRLGKYVPETRRERMLKLCDPCRW